MNVFKMEDYELGACWKCPDARTKDVRPVAIGGDRDGLSVARVECRLCGTRWKRVMVCEEATAA